MSVRNSLIMNLRSLSKLLFAHVHQLFIRLLNITSSMNVKKNISAMNSWSSTYKCCVIRILFPHKRQQFFTDNYFVWGTIWIRLLKWNFSVTSYHPETSYLLSLDERDSLLSWYVLYLICLSWPFLPQPNTKLENWH